MNLNDNILTVEQLAEKLQRSESWVYKKIHAKIIPHFRIGSTVRFSQKDIEQWMDAHRVKGALKV
jgi:excisionase family DNA binding protein